MAFRILFATLLVAGFSTAAAQAATRTVYFSQTGRNVVSNSFGLGSAGVASVCRIFVSNPSPHTQLVTVFATATSTGNVSPATNTSTPGTEISLAAGSTASPYELTYTAFPINTGNLNQQLLCSGRIVVRDLVDANPGYIVANGTLTTFTSGGTIQTAGTTTATTSGGGTAIFTQIPISINRSKPF